MFNHVSAMLKHLLHVTPQVPQESPQALTTVTETLSSSYQDSHPGIVCKVFKLVCYLCVEAVVTPQEDDLENSLQAVPTITEKLTKIKTE